MSVCLSVGASVQRKSRSTSNQIGSIDANCLIKDSLLQMGLQLSAYHGQCYDGASNMTGQRNGVATQILHKEKHAVYVH